jgi:hypothetical protein
MIAGFISETSCVVWGFMMAWKLFGQSAVDTGLFPAATTYGTVVITSAGTTAVASVFLAEGGHGNIVGFLALITAVSSPGTLACRVSAQSVSSRGVPSGTPLGGASPVSYTTSGTLSVGVLSGTFANSLPVSAGDLLALNLEYASGSGTSVTVAQRNSVNSTVRGMPYTTSFASSTWTVSTIGTPTIAPLYADGYVGHGFGVTSSLTNTGTSLTNSSSPYFWGNSFTPNVAMTFVGADTFIRMPDASGLICTLFETVSGVASAVSTSTTFDGSKTAANSGSYLLWIPMPTYTVQPGLLYHLVLNNTTSTAFSTWITMTFPNVATLAAIGGPLAGCTANASAHPAFTELSTQLAPLCPVFDDISVPTGGGLFTNNLNGGMS